LANYKQSPNAKPLEMHYSYEPKKTLKETENTVKKINSVWQII
jgi:hypothetical protein